MSSVSGAHILVGIASLVVLAAIVGGLLIVDSPSDARSSQFDERRLDDLREITRAVDLHWERHGRLPTTLDSLARESWKTMNVNDPRSNEAYGFRIVDTRAYELCADFEHSSTKDAGDGSGFWSHETGRQCYELEAQRTHW